MSRVITIDPGKSKCGVVLAEISEKKDYKAIILKSELLGDYVRNLITAEEISLLKEAKLYLLLRLIPAQI